MTRSRRAILLSLWFAAVALYTLWPVHNRTAIVFTMGNDLANHVRHVYEAALALREGQVPPLVCPKLEGGTRLPLFQYYSGTSYWAPAVWSLVDSNPYRALKVGVFLHVFAGGWAVYGVGVLLGKRVQGSGFRVREGSAETGVEISDLGFEISDLRSQLSDFKPESGSTELAEVRTLNPEPSFLAAVVAGTAFQTAPFSSADFYERGSYTEFCALHMAAVVLYAALRVGRARGRRESALWVCLCGLAVAYFVPLHPVQTLLCGVLIALLVAVDVVERRTLTPALSRGTGRGGRAGEVLRALGKLALAAGLGVAGAAWFWWPVVRDYSLLRIVPHGAFLDAGLADPWVLLWPTYRRAATYPWGPQLGLHFALAAVAAVVWWRAGRAVGVAAGLMVVAVVLVVLFHEHLPAVQHVLKPLQWSYRLLVPATLAGAVCVAVVLAAVLRRAGDAAAGRVVAGAAMAWVLGTSIPYFAGTWERSSRVRNVVAPTWEAPNSTGSYALRGMDYRRLGIVRADGMLNANVNLVVPPEGVTTEIEVLVRPVVSGAATSVVVNVTKEEPLTPTLSPEYRGEGGRKEEPLTPALSPEYDSTELVEVRGEGGRDDGRVRVRFRVNPRVGHVPGDRVIRFGTAADWRVEDVTYRAVDDDAGMACRLPEKWVRRDRGKLTELEIDVPAGREGWYQLPVYVLPSNEVTVNDAVVNASPSANRAMVIARLGTGRNVVKIRTLPTRAAWGVSGVAMIGMIVGLSVAGLRGWTERLERD